MTNDDGVGAPGIDAMVEALEALPDVDVDVIAPADDQSGTGLSTSAVPPIATIATTQSGHRATAVHGFPADAVLFAQRTGLLGRVDVVGYLHEVEPRNVRFQMRGMAGAADLQ